MIQLCKILKLIHLSRAIDQVVSNLLVTAETWVCSWVNPCGICGGTNLHWDMFSSKHFGCLLSTLFHRG
jgi:hypothetical protein